MKPVSWSRRLRSFWLTHAPTLFARWCTLDDRELGEWGEEIAARYLRHRGCRILGRRLKTDIVEIDIVALERGAIVCVEVKTGRLEPLPRPRGSPAATNFAPTDSSVAARIAAGNPDATIIAAGSPNAAMLAAGSPHAAMLAAGGIGALRWRPGRRCDADRIARLERAARRLGDHGPAHVDLIEVILPMVTRRPHLVHHRDVKRPLR